MALTSSATRFFHDFFLVLYISLTTGSRQITFKLPGREILSLTDGV